jgi:hypothetical protein
VAANRLALENWSANPEWSLYEVLENCISYTTYSYQKNLCTMERFKAGYGIEVPIETLQNIAYLYPFIPRLMRKTNECMADGDPTETMICAQVSRSIENFANGRISATENMRQIQQFTALLTEYRKPPSLGDLLLGAGQVFAESAARNRNAQIEYQLEQLRMQQFLIQDQLERQRRQRSLR